MSWCKSSHQWIPVFFIIIAGLLAYYGPGGRLFGKNADGRLSPARAALMLPFLLVCWAVWHAQSRLTPESCWNEIAPGLFLGRRPLPGEHPPASLVVDLTAEFPSVRPACRINPAQAESAMLP